MDTEVDTVTGQPISPDATVGTKTFWSCLWKRDAARNCTQPWNYAQIYLSSLRNTVLTSMSVWKLNKSIFCQLLPSRAKTFHAWEGDRQFRGTQAWTFSNEKLFFLCLNTGYIVYNGFKSSVHLESPSRGRYSLPENSEIFLTQL